MMTDTKDTLPAEFQTPEVLAKYQAVAKPPVKTRVQPTMRRLCIFGAAALTIFLVYGRNFDFSTPHIFVAMFVFIGLFCVCFPSNYKMTKSKSDNGYTTQDDSITSKSISEETDRFYNRYNPYYAAYNPSKHNN